MPTGTQVASLFGVLSLDDDDFQRGAKNAAGTMKSLGQGMTSLGGNLTALGAPFLAIAGVAENSFETMDLASRQLNAVIKSTGGAAGVTATQALQLGQSLQDLSGVTRAQVVSGEAMMLSFTNIGGTVFPRATKAALDLSVAMKQDMKSSVIQLGKALNDPIKQLTALTRVGVTFTQSQKDMIESMQKAGNIAGAQGIILTEIEKEFGGSAAAAATPIAKLGATLNDLAIDVGVALQPVLESVIPVVQDLAKHISEFLNSMSDQGNNTVGIILAIGAGLAIIGPIIAVIGMGITAIGGVLAVVLSPIGLVVAAVVGLFLAFQNNFLGIRDFLQPVIDSIGNFFAHFSDNVKLYGSLALMYFEYYILNPLSDFWNTSLKPAFDAFVNWFKTDGLPFITNALNDFKTNVWDKIVGAVGTIWDAVKGGLMLFSDWFTVGGGAGGLEAIKVAINLFLTNVVNPFIKKIQDIWTSIQPQLEVLKLGMQAVFGWINTNVIQPIINALQGIIDKVTQAVNAFAIIGSGQLSVGQILQAATTGTVTGSYSVPNSGGVAPIPPVGGGSGKAPDGSVGVGAQGITMHQPTFNIHANSEAEGQSAMRGALNAARAAGY